jgi:hypothetical protein
MIRRTTILVTLLLVACGKHDGNDPSQPLHAAPERLVVIFADVTGSLTLEQVVSVQTHVQRIIMKLPPHTIVHVFSIGQDTETAREIATDTTPPDDYAGAGADNGLIQWRATLATTVHEKLEQLYENRGNTEPTTLSSCITTALRRTAGLAAHTTRRLDMVIVSDMIEECENSLLGGSASLMKRNIDKEIQSASQIKGQPPDLRRATVTLVRPQFNVSTAAQSNQPSAADVERFWRELLAHCNTDTKQVSFGADVPDELFSK